MLDRLSDLPESLLIFIMSLSLMTARDAVQTSVVSKAWQNLWTSLPYVHLDSKEFTSDEKFCDFVDIMLSRRETHTDTFELWCQQLREGHYESIERWIRYAMRNNTRVLRISAHNSSIFPDCIFSSESLVELDLSSETYKLHNSGCPVSMVNLPRLRILRLQGLGFWLVSGFLEKLLLGCPKLEGLSLSLARHEVWPVLGLFSENLKNQTISKFPGVVIEASGLGFMHLYYSRSAEGLARLIDLDLLFLFEANIMFHINQPLEIASYFSVLSGLSNVERLQLCIHIQNLKGFGKMPQMVLPSMLANLQYVSICGLFASDGFYYLADLYQYAPNLREINLWQSCRGCLFHKAGVDDWEDKSGIVSTEQMKGWRNALMSMNELRKVHISISHFNYEVGQKVHALLDCWWELKNVQMYVTD